MRLGAYKASLKKGTKIADIYGSTDISERHRHRYEVNVDYKDRLENCGLVFSGMSPDGVLPETSNTRSSLVHRRPVPPGTESAPARAASAVQASFIEAAT
jgi:CTP synthase (UTP-ammonia lyase)